MTRAQFSLKELLLDPNSNNQLGILGTIGGYGDNNPLGPTGIQTITALNIYNGSKWDRARGATAIPDNYSGMGLLGTAQSLWNGSTYDMIRNNNQGTLLASGARTAYTNSPTQTNYNAKGVVLFLNVTVASGTGGLIPRIVVQDPVSGQVIQIGADPTAITATGLYIYEYYPGIGIPISGNLKNAISMVLPRTWFAQVNVGDTSSYTYSLGYSYIL